MEVRQSAAPRRCNCRKTRCLKLYCECFLAGRFCEEGCGCVDCANRAEGGLEREQAIQGILEKNPLAFQSLDHPLDRQQRGCNCKKSFCQKRYCECFNKGVGCLESCKCTQCLNIYNTPPEDALPSPIWKKNIVIVNNIDNPPLAVSLQLTKASSVSYH